MNLRDDKTYFSLRMDMNVEFPRLTIIRKVLNDGARISDPIPRPQRQGRL